MTPSWSLFALLVLVFAAPAQTFTDEHRWTTITGSCTHTCGPYGIRPSLVLCQHESFSSVDEVHCHERGLEKPAPPPMEPCNRKPCEEPPVISTPPPLHQTTPISSGDKVAHVRQNVTIHAGSQLRIDAIMSKEGLPKASIEWKLADGMTLALGSTSGRFQALSNGSLVISNVALGDAGEYSVTASNSVGSDSGATTVSVVVAPQFSPAEPLVQPSPIPDQDWSINLGQDVSIVRGNQLVVSSTIAAGVPDPAITWTLADGMTTLAAGESSGSASVSADGTRLTIQNVQFSNEGSYVATATNIGGSATETTRVTVIEPPQFSSPAPINQAQPIPDRNQVIELNQDVHIVSGNRLVINAALTQGRPDPAITWTLPDGSTLNAGQRNGRFIVSANGLRMTVNNIQVGEGGAFVATATNNAGSATGTSQVTVVQPPAFKPVDPLVQDSPISNQDLSMDAGQDIKIVRGNQLVINATVTGTPDPTISWRLPGGQMLGVGQSQGQYSVLPSGALQIQNIQFGDAGEYVATAANEAGTTTARSQVSVVEPPAFKPVQPLPDPPVVPDTDQSIDVNQDVSIVRGNRLLIDAALVSGTPDPTISWTLPGGGMISPGQRIERFFVFPNGTLEIQNIQPDEDATYVVTATNDAGTATGRSRVSVLQPPAFKPVNPLVQTRPIPDQDLSMDVGQDVSIVRGNQLVINAVATGIPDATISWRLPSGQNLGVGETSGRFSVTPNGALQIQNAQFGDEGGYVATASNKAGSVTAQSQVSVVEPPAFKPVNPLPQPPSVPNTDQSIDVNQNVEMVQGNQLLIDAVLVSGRPNPAISWTLPGGAQLTPGQSFGRFQVYPNGTLGIQNSQPEDDGTYTVTATNDAGTATGQSQVTVLQPPVFKAVNPLVQPPVIPNRDYTIDANQDVTVLAGNQLVINADVVTAKPDATISWTLPDGSSLSPGQTSTDGRFSVLPSGALQMDDTALGDDGTYTATATNRAGTTTATTMVTVVKYSWHTIVGSCTHTCGTQGIKPSLVACKDDKTNANTDAVHCGHLPRPATPPPEPCNRVPCPRKPIFVIPDPLDQARPLPCQNLNVRLGQNVIVHASYRLTINAQLQPGAEPSPMYVWTLPSGQNLGPGESSGNVRVNAAGTRLIITDSSGANDGVYNLTAANSEGSASLSSEVIVDEFSWEVITGSCTHTCGDLGVKPSLVRCKDDKSISLIPEDEANCCSAPKPPTPPLEPCNRIPCPKEPGFVVPEPLVQTRPVACTDMAVTLGQNVIVHAERELQINAQLQPNISPSPDLVWTLPSGATLGAGQSSGNIRVSASGANLTISAITSSNAGQYLLTATNSEGTAALATEVTVDDYRWETIVGSCTHTCGPLGIKPALVRCKNENSASLAPVDEANCCEAKPETPPAAPCNRDPCPVPPLFFDPPPLNQPRPIPDQPQTIDVDQNVLIQEGNTLRIRGRIVQGIPDPTVTWTLPNGRTLNVGQTSGRFSVGNDGTLQVRNIRLTDAGLFSALAVNDAGRDTAQSTVTVIRPPALVEPTPGPTRDPDAPFPGGNQRVNVGDDITMYRGNTLFVDAPLVPGVTGPVNYAWQLPDGSTLRPGETSGRFRVLPTGSLRIQNVQFDDDGAYTVTASNVGGSVMGTTTLTVVDFSWIPVPGDCSQTCGPLGTRSFTLACQNEKIDPKPIVPNTNCNVKPRPTLPPPEDCNRVNCPGRWVVGDFGPCSATCAGTQTQVVYCEQQQGIGGIIQVSDDQCTEAKPQAQTRACPAGALLCAIAPEFIDPPDVVPDNQVNRDRSFFLKQQASIAERNRLCIHAVLKDGTGIPRDQTTITWTLKDRETKLVPGETSGRVVVLANGTLCINNVQTDDSGLYTADTENVAGKDTGSTSVTVYKRPEITDNRVRSGGSTVLPPTGGTGSRRNVEVPRTEDVALFCDATGIPPPTVEWFRNGVPIDSDDDRFTVLPTGELQINDAEPDDSATYTCRATNLVGTTESITSLSVRDFPAQWVVVREPCSATCGEGTRLVVSECRNRTNNATLPDEACSHEQRPLHFRESCTLGDCSKMWVVGPFSDCSATCGGTRRREVYCQTEVYPGLPTRVSDEECLAAMGPTAGPKPASMETCGFSLETCPQYSWDVTEFGNCSVKCGSGTQTREVTCVRKTVTETTAVPVSDCYDRPAESGPRPTSQQVCTRDCRFEPGPWGVCNLPAGTGCGQGQTTRNLTCYETLDDGSEAATDNAGCEAGAVEQPLTTQACFVPCVCTQPQWMVGPWSDCTRTCAGGVQYRDVRCNCSYSGAPAVVVGNEVCDAPGSGAGARPLDQQSCGEGQCPCINHRWSSGTWSDCSVTCGTGQQTRNNSCVCFRDGVREEEKDKSLCPSNQPSETRSCVRSRCECPTATWNVSADPSSVCSQTCGGGTRPRLVTCTCNGQPVDETACVVDANLPKPLSFESCNPQECPCEGHRYRWSPWSPCDKPCGNDAVQTRRVTCQCRVEGVVRVVDVDRCEAAGVTPVPPSTRSCAKPCPCDYVEYRPGPWGSCPAECDEAVTGRRVQKRNVTCSCTRGSVTRTVADRFCDQALVPRPPKEQDCAPCSFRWVVGPWSTCYRDCHQRRDVKCVADPSGKEVNESNCYSHHATVKPVTLGKCNYTGPRLPKDIWDKSEWSPCSRPCGFGTKTRVVTCVNACTAERSDRCTPNHRPIETKACFDAPCSGECKDRKGRKFCESMAEKKFCNLDKNFYRCCESCRGYRGLK